MMLSISDPNIDCTSNPLATMTVHQLTNALGLGLWSAAKLPPPRTVD